MDDFDLGHGKRSPIEDALRIRLLETVRLHKLMFERLLAEESLSDAKDIAQVLRDAGHSYIEFSREFASTEN
ncbi:MAG TPA: hypothetical protein VIG55_05280 [Methylosinus sp.]|jgi:hypothetical protein